MNLNADYRSVWMYSVPLPARSLLHVLMLPDFERADRIGEFWGYPEPRLRRAADRLRGGPDAPGGARRDAAGGRALSPSSLRARQQVAPRAFMAHDGGSLSGRPMPGPRGMVAETQEASRPSSRTPPQKLFGGLCLVTGNRQEAEEVTQDAYPEALGAMGSRQPHGGPDGFLFRTAMNCSARYRRTVLALRQTIVARAERR